MPAKRKPAAKPRRLTRKTIGRAKPDASPISSTDLPASDENYRLLVEQMSDGLFIADSYGYYIDVNPAGCRLLGYTRAEIIGKHLRDLTKPDNQPLRLDELRTGKVFLSEREMICKDGSLVAVEISAKQLPDGRLQGIVRDVTERKRTEAQLAEKTKFMQIATQMTPDIVYLYHAQLRHHLFINRELASLLGYANEDVQTFGADLLLQAVHPDDLPRVMRHIETLAQTDSDDIFEIEYRIKGKQGEYLWFSVREQVYQRDANGRPEILFGVVQDTTARKQVTGALQRQNQLLLALQNTTVELVAQLDLNTLLENIVRRAGALMGTASGFLDLVDPATHQLEPRVGIGVLAESLNHVVQPGEGLAGVVWQTGQPLVIDNYDQWAGRIRKFSRGALSSIIGVPLWSGERVIGVLGLGYDSGSARRFDSDAIEVLNQFARLATVALENARLFAALQNELTERKQAERQVLRLTRLYATLSQVNQTIVRVKSSAELYQAICNIAIDYGQFPLAWIGLLDRASGDVKPVAHAGANGDYVDSLNINLNDEKTGHGPTGIALRTGNLVINDDTQTNPAMAPWRAVASQYDYRSSVAIPFRLKNETIGLLNLYSTEPGFFSAPDERRLLEEISLDISFALDTLALDAERAHSEQALRESEEQFRTLYQSMTEWVVLHEIVYDSAGQAIDYRLLDCNPAFTAGTGITRAQAIGALASQLYGTGVAPYLDIYARVAQSGEPVHFETYFPPMQKYFRVSAFSPHPGRFATVTFDLTEHKHAEEALRASEERYRLISENAADVIWVLDPIAGKFTYVSPSVEKLRGYTPAEVMAQPMAAALTPASLQLVTESLAQSLPAFIAQGTGTASFITQVDQPRKDGSIVNTEVTTTYLFNEQGQVEIVGVSRDITERQRAEAERQRLFNIIERSLNEIYLFDAHSLKFSYVNNGALKNLGYTLNAMLEMTPLDIKPGYTEESFRAAIQPLLTGDKDRLAFEEVHRRADGSLYPVQVHLQLTHNGNSQAFLAIINDITERKRAEESVRESEEKFRLFVEHAPAAMAMFDREMRYLAVSQRWMQAYHLTGEILGRSHYDIFPEIPERWKAVHRRSLAGAIEKNEEDRFERADGSVQWIKWEVRPWTNSAGEIGGIVIFSEDITESKLDKERLTKATERLDLATHAAHIGVWDWNIPADEVVWDDRMSELYGITKADFDGAYQAWLQGVHPDDRATSDEQVAKALRGDVPFDTEFRVVWRDGTIHWLKANARVIRDATGAPVRMIGVNYDITDRKRAEFALRFQAAIADNMAEGVSLMRQSDTTILYTNPAFDAMFGYAPGELLNQKASVLNYAREGKTAQQISDDIVALLARESKADFEIQNRKKDGTPFWCRVHSALYEHPEYGIVNVNVREDITERRRAEENLRERERFISAITNTSPALIYVYDLETQSNVYTNPGILRVLGYTPTDVEAMGTNLFARLIHPDDMPTVVAFQSKIAAANDGDILEIEYRMRHTNGKWCWLRSYESPFLRNPDGTLRQKIGIAIDVTERRVAETRILAQLDELRRWQSVMLNQSDRNQELKREVNELTRRLGEPIRYPSQADTDLARPTKGVSDES